MPVHGHQSDYIGSLKESTYKVNPAPDFTVLDTYCNPIFSNEDNAANITINKPDEKTEKALNSRHLTSSTDNKNGRTDYTLTMGGNIKNSGFGYILEMFNQVATFSTNMIYKLEVADNECRTNSYHFYVPRACSATRNAFIAGGCVPSTLTIDYKTQIWTAEFNCATKDDEPTTVQIPGNDNYRDIDTIDKANYPETFGQLTIAGDTQKTTSLSQTIEYTMADNLGFYGTDGFKTGFLIIGMTSTIDFSLPYSDTVETDNKSKTYWLGADGNTQYGQFGVTNTSDVNSSIELTCYGSLTGVVRDTPGNEMWNFTGQITVQQEKDDDTKDYSITHKDALGDITTNF